MKNKVTLFLMMAMALSLSGPAMAGSQDMFGVSSRGTAMGGAMVGIANGWEATYYNPSALALSRDSSSFQYHIVDGSLMRNEENAWRSGYGITYGYNRRILRDRIGIGLILGTGTSDPGDMLSLDFGSLLGGGGPPNWNWQQYSDSSPILASVGVGFRLTNWLSVGVSAQQDTGMITTSFYPLVVDPLLDLLLGINTGLTPDNVPSFNFAAGSDPDGDYNTAYNISFRPVKYVSFGYVYKPESWTKVKFRLELVGIEGSILSTSQWYLFDMRFPGQVETTIYGGAGHIPIPWNDGTLTLSYSHEIQNWDGFYPYSVQFDWNEGDFFDPNFFKDPIPRDPGLEDVAFDRYGFEYEGDATPMMFWRLKNLSRPRFVVRGGYYHWNTPQPDADYTWQVAMIDSDADVYSFGMGFGYDRKKGKRAVATPAFPPRVAVDFHYQQITLDDRDYIMQPDEWGSIPFSNYVVRTEGSLTQYGVQVTLWQ